MISSTACARALLLAVVALPVAAQQAPLNFRDMRIGRWTNEVTGTRNGNQVKPLVTTTCTPPLSVVAVAELKRLTASMQPACNLRVLIDVESTLEYERVCIIGGNQNVTHTTLQAVDDETLTMETYYSVPGYGETVTRVKSTYVSPCGQPESP